LLYVHAGFVHYRLFTRTGDGARNLDSIADLSRAYPAERAVTRDSDYHSSTWND